MNKKQIALLIIITLIPFIIFSAGRPDLVGADTYYFLISICGEETLGETDLVRTIFSFLPCNFIFLKILLFFLCLICTITLALTGELLYKKNGWMAGLFIFIAPIFFAEFTKLENDQFTFPLIFLAIYFYYKGFFKNKYANRIISIALLVFSTLIWGGSILFLLAFAFGSVLFLIASIPIIAVFWNKLLSTALPRFPNFDLFGNVWENSLLVGIAYLFLLPLGYNGINRMIFPQIVFFTVLFLLNSKFVLLVTPFLALGFVGYFNKLDFSKYGKNFKQIFIWLPFFMALSWGLVSLEQPPQPHHWEAIDFALQESSKPGITNDWDFGYWILFKGGRTQQFGSPKDFNLSHDVFITRKNFDVNACAELGVFEDVRVYKCGRD